MRLVIGGKLVRKEGVSREEVAGRVAFGLGGKSLKPRSPCFLYAVTLLAAPHTCVQSQYSSPTMHRCFYTQFDKFPWY